MYDSSSYSTGSSTDFYGHYDGDYSLPEYSPDDFNRTGTYMEGGVVYKEEYNEITDEYDRTPLVIEVPSLTELAFSALQQGLFGGKDIFSHSLDLLEKQKKEIIQRWNITVVSFWDKIRRMCLRISSSGNFWTRLKTWLQKYVDEQCIRQKKKWSIFDLGETGICTLLESQYGVLPYFESFKTEFLKFFLEAQSHRLNPDTFVLNEMIERKTWCLQCILNTVENIRNPLDYVSRSFHPVVMDLMWNHLESELRECMADILKIPVKKRKMFITSKMSLSKDMIKIELPVIKLDRGTIKKINILREQRKWQKVSQFLGV